MSLPNASESLPVYHGRNRLSFLLFGLSASAIGLLVCPGGCPPAPTAVDPGQDTVVAGATSEVNPATSGADENIVPVTFDGGEIHISDQILATMQDTPLTFVFDMETSLADVLEFSVIAPPEAGTVIESRDGSRIELTYDPDEGFFGQDEFRLEVSDGSSSSTASITVIVHPQVRFEAEVLSQQPVLLVEARAFTMTGHDLPAGTYTWYADSQPESGSVSTHASQQFSFATTGTHILSLTLTLAGMSTPISCSYGPEGDVKIATFRSADGDSGPIQSRLRVTPDTGLQSSGEQGGPFNPDSIVYTVTNLGRQTMDWATDITQDWVSSSQTSGRLAMNESVEVNLRLNANANNLPVGNHSAAVTFKNLTKGRGHVTRSALLVIDEPGQPDPGVLAIASAEGLDSAGLEGGPFDPNSIRYRLTNEGGEPLEWSASNGRGWVSLSGSGGSLDPGEFVNVDVSINSNGNGLAVGSYRDTVSFINATDGSGDTTRSVALTVDAEPDPCVTSTSVWQNFPITAQAGVFTARFDAVPNNDNMTGHTVLSEGPGAAYQDYAILIGFGPSGFIDARDGGSYRAETQIPYTAGTAYHFRVEVSVPAHTYSVYVTPEGAGELTLATGFAFRSEQSAVAGLDHWALMAPSGWSHEVCNFVIASSGGMLSVSPGDGLTSSGNEGGPFSPDSKQYVLTNTGDAAIDWSAAKSQPWLDLSPAGGLLDAGAYATVTVSINANANGLSAGIHQDSVTFTNDTNGSGDTSRPVSLTVDSTVGVLAVTPSVGLSSSGFEGGPFDPSSITYTLENVGATAIGYSVAKSAAWLSLNGGDGPLAGSLAPAETFQVAVSINANANGLSADTYPDSVAFANTTNGLGNTERSVSLNVRTPGSGTPTPVIVASRISGMAPFAVFFEATDSTDTLGRSINSHGLLGNDILEYTWDFGPGTEGDVGGRYFSGFNGAHVYETPGDYGVLLTVREASGQASLTLRVTAQPFSGTTYYVSAAGNDANNGTSPATAWKTYNKAFNAIRNNRIVRPGDHVLFRRGDVFNYSSSSHLGSARNVLIAAYGTGNRPRIQYTGSSIGAVAIQGGANAISIVDIIIDGNNVAHAAYGSDNRLFLRMLFTNYNNIPIYADGTFIVDSVLTNAIKQNMFHLGSRLALINSEFGPVQREHNLYGALIDRAVITGNYWHDARGAGIRIAAGANRDSRNIVISGNELARIASPIELKVTEPGVSDRVRNVLIERNYVHGWVWIADLGGHTDVIVRNNLLDRLVLRVDRVGWSNPRRGVQGLRFCNNTLTYGGTGAAIKIETSDHSDVQLFNNIIQANNGASGILVLEIVVPSGVAGVASDYNLFDLPNQGSNPRAFRIGGTNYTLAEWQANFSQDINGLMADPLFNPASPSGLELLPGSPAIDRGQTLPLVYEDYSSPPIRRPAGAYDIGAFER